LLILLGVAVVVVGFAVGLNPLLVVVLAAFATGVLAGHSPVEVLAAFGKAFNANRFVSVVLVVYPLVGVLERAGLQAQARQVIARWRGLSVGPLLIAYLAFRQLTAALGLMSVAGQVQTIRPLVGPMEESAVEARLGTLDAGLRQAVLARAAATDTVGLFFGEDIFVAVGSILLMVGFLAESGISLDPLRLSAWAIPTAVAAFLIHGTRLALFDRALRRRAR